MFDELLYMAFKASIHNKLCYYGCILESYSLLWIILFSNLYTLISSPTNSKCLLYILITEYKAIVSFYHRLSVMVADT